MLVDERNNIACGNYHFEIRTENSVSIFRVHSRIKISTRFHLKSYFGALTHRENEIMESKAKLDKIQRMSSTGNLKLILSMG